MCVFGVGALSQPVHWCSQYRQTSSVSPSLTHFQLPYHPFHFLPLHIQHSGLQGWWSLSQQTRGGGGPTLWTSGQFVTGTKHPHTQTYGWFQSSQLAWGAILRWWEETGVREPQGEHANVQKGPVVQESYLWPSCYEVTARATAPPCHQWVASNLLSFNHFMAGIIIPLRSKTGQPMKGQNCFSFLDAANLQLGFRSFSVMHVKLCLNK